jgi:hypothetical protein
MLYAMLQAQHPDFRLVFLVFFFSSLVPTWLFFQLPNTAGCRRYSCPRLVESRIHHFLAGLWVSIL